MSLINKIYGRSLDQVTDMLSEAYIKSASLEKSAIDPDVKRALIGAALGAGVGGTGMAAKNLVTGKKLSLRDVIRGALLGSVPGAALGYVNPLEAFSNPLGVFSNKEVPPPAPTAAPAASGPTKEERIAEDKALIAKGQPPKNFTIKDLAYFGAIPPLKLQHENTEAARKLDELANKNRVKFEDKGIEKFPVLANPDLGRFAPDVLAPYRKPEPVFVPTPPPPTTLYGGEPTRTSEIDKIRRAAKGIDKKGPLLPYNITPPKK